MRIAYLLPASVASSDGLALARAFERLGHEVVVLAGAPVASDDLPVRTTALAPFDEQAVELLADDVGAGAGEALAAFLRGSALRATAASLLPSFEPDVVFERWAPFTAAGAELARAAGASLVVEVGGTPNGTPDAGSVATLRTTALEAADLVVTTSAGLRTTLVHEGVRADGVTVVPTAMDVDGFEMTKPVRDALRSLLNVSDRHCVGVLADLGTDRDVATVARAVDALRRRGQEVTLLAVGDGTARSELEALEHSLDGLTMILPGVVPEEQVPAYLAAMDVAVAPATDGSPFPTDRLLQYMAAGLPVVAADSEAVEHCVRHGETGVLYRPGDADAMADALAGLLADPERGRALGSAGREHVAHAHSWDECARTILGLLAPNEHPEPVEPPELATPWAASAPETERALRVDEVRPPDHFERGAYAAG
jgi:glycosyltransferase involved in cell wall biosynthesis